MRFLTILSAVVVTTFFLAVPYAGSAPISPVEGLELLRRAFAGVDDFSATITQEKQLSLMKKKMVARGEVHFRKPDLFSMELYPPYASRILLKDNILTLKLPDDREPQKVTLPPDQGLGSWFRLIERPVRSLPEGFDVRADRSDGIVMLRISPLKKGAMKRVDLWFREDGRLTRLVLEENNADKTAITFHKMRTNTGLTEKDFGLE